MKLYILRHGQAHANIKGLVTGSPADTLTNFGRSQAIEAGKLLKTITHDLSGYYVSHWRRAAETGALSIPDAQFVIDKRVGETCAGSVANMRREDFEASAPKFFVNFDPDAAFPEGESHNDLYNRVVDWLRETSYKHKKDSQVLLSTHMGPISCILQYAFSISMAQFPRFKPDNGSITVLEVPPGATPSAIDLQYYNLLKYPKTIHA